MSVNSNRRQLSLMAAVAVLAFGVVMFIAGRATAPTVTTSSVTTTASTSDPAPSNTGSSNAGSSNTGSSNTGPANTVSTAEADAGVAGSTPEDVDNANASGVDETELPPGCDPLDDFPTVALSELPGEAYDTIGVIADGPPYPYRADGGVFQNREGNLPDRERNYYHEFTVETPGSSDRGARRIVTGDCGEFFYTADHYDSFELIDLDR